jgi:purine-nucleoside phosphorylase
MPSLHDQIEEAATAIASRWKERPQVGIVLGTGLGNLASAIETEVEIAYGDIPHFPVSTAPGHHGRFIGGRLEGLNVAAMDGRFHRYEGYSLAQITLPIRVFKKLGCEFVILSNACGGLNHQWAKGDLMVIEDHINLMGDNPLIGPNDDRLGDRFPDMSEPYDRTLISEAMAAALETGIQVHKGVYVAVPGPCLETRAEYRFLRTIGADVVGMSTVPEVIVAVHAGLKAMGFSIITDMCLPDALEPANVAEIIKVANEAEGKLTQLVRRILARRASRTNS